MQESDGGTIHRASNYPDLLLVMQTYCCPIEILYFILLVFIEIRLEFRTACQDRQAVEVP